MSRIGAIQRLGAGVAAAVLALASPASAAELVAAELEGTANQVTVEQGKSQNFNISLSATGSVACGSTHTAQVHKSYAVSAAGAVSSQTLSDFVNFSAASGSSSNCDITWTGAPTPQTVAAAVSATATTPVGTYTVILSEGNGNTATSSTNSSGGKLDDKEATTLTIKVVTPTVSKPANTAPTVSVTGVTDGAKYVKGSVPAATCNVKDAEDGSPTVNATLSAIEGDFASDGIGNQTASCEYTDAGGLTVKASATYSIVDPSPPDIASNLSPSAPDGLNGWYKSNVSLAWTVTEKESPNSLQKTGCVNQDVTADQAETKYSCSASSAGGSAAAEVTIKRDATPPTNVTFQGGPTDGATYYLGLDTIPAAPTCSASDATSLVASCDVTGYNTAVGTHTVQATAADNAGNKATSSSITYTVANLTLKGFYEPVNSATNVVNTVKGGSTVPLKFEVFAGSTELTVTSIVESFKTRSAVCDSNATPDEVDITSTGGTSLRYDATGGQFVQNWATPKSPGTCVRATLTLKGGQAISADFRLR